MVTRSSTKVKYKDIVNVVVKLWWLYFLLSKHSYLFSSLSILWCENFKATYLTTNVVFQLHMKHIEIDFHFVNDIFVKKGAISLVYCHWYSNSEWY
jgi:hypothetical protein